VNETNNLDNGDAFGPGSCAPHQAPSGLGHSAAIPIAFPDVHMAVFNGHVNDAAARAMAILRLITDPEAPDMMALERCYADGVMSIFQQPPNDATGSFAVLCYVFANGLEALDAQGIEARRAETHRGSVGDESPVGNADALNPSSVVGGAS